MPDFSNSSILMFYIIYTILAAALTTAASYKIMQMLQLGSYRVKGLNAWFKMSKYDYIWRYFALSFLSVVVMVVYIAAFSKLAELAHYFGALAFFIFGVLFIIISLKSSVQKTPLKLTKRIWRLMVVSLILNASVILALLFIGAQIPNIDYYAFSGLAYLAIPGTTILAHFIMLPIEILIKKSYIKKAARAIGDKQNLIKIGITGSFGKTSAKNVLHKMLEKKYKTVSTPASFNTPMGICKTVNELLSDETEVLIAEMGARYEGDIIALCDMVKPQIGIITGIGNQHLETFGSLEVLYKTKYSLIGSLAADGKAFFNGESENALKMYGECPLENKTVAFNKELHKNDENAAVYYDVKYDKNGAKFKLKIGGEVVDIKTKLLGKHIPNLITLCASVAHNLGVSLDEIALAAKELLPVKHRLELIDNGDTIVIDDAYNSNLDGVINALEVLSLFEGVKIIVTPGLVELGKEEAKANTQLGKEIAKYADYAILNSTLSTYIKKGCMLNSMGEDKIIIADGLKDAMTKLEKIEAARKVILFANDLPDNLK